MDGEGSDFRVFILMIIITPALASVDLPPAR